MLGFILYTKCVIEVMLFQHAACTQVEYESDIWIDSDNRKFELYMGQIKCNGALAEGKLIGDWTKLVFCEMSCFLTKMRIANSTILIQKECIISSCDDATILQDGFSNVSVVSCIVFSREQQLGSSFAKTGSLLQLKNISLLSQIDSMEMNSFVFMKSDSPIWNPSVLVTVSSSSFSSVLISTTFFASSVIDSTLEFHDSAFFNISATQNASIQEQKPNSCSITISNSAFNHVYGVYDGVLIPSISFDVHSLIDFNSTHVSCTRWVNKRYSNETLERVVLDPSVDKEFTFDSCTWKGIKGDEFGQCIFARTQDQTVLTLTVKNCNFQDCASYIGSGGAIFVTGNVAVTIENSSFQDINGENENKNVETTAGAVHVISIRSPAIRKCLFFDCSSNADACVVFERKLSQIPQRKTDFCGNHTIWHQNNYSQIRERNNFPFEGNCLKMQTKWNSDPDEFFKEVEPVLIQCTFLRCYSQGSGGGLYLKDVEERALIYECDFSGCKANYGGAIYVVVANAVFLSCDRRLRNQDFYCIYMSYFAVNTADKYGHDAFVASEADYDDGLKLFSLCKTSELKEGAVVQMKRSKPDEIFFLSKSLEVARRIIELDSTAPFSVACGSSEHQQCQTLSQVLSHSSSNENLKCVIHSNAKSFVRSSCSIKEMELEIDGNGGGAIEIDIQNFDEKIFSVLDIGDSTFTMRNLAVIYPKMKLYPYSSIVGTADYLTPSSIIVDHVIFRCSSISEQSFDLQRKLVSTGKPLISNQAEHFCFFMLDNFAYLTIVETTFSDAPTDEIRSIIFVWNILNLTIVDCAFKNISSNINSPILFNGAFFQGNFVSIRNITADLITTNSICGGFIGCSLYEGTCLAITNSSFQSCSATNNGGALSINIVKEASLILDQLSFFNNSAEKYRDMRFYSYSLLDINIQGIFSFVDKEIDGMEIGCFDSLNYMFGISIAELLTTYEHSTIFVSSSLGTDFTRCGTQELPCRSLTYGWTHLCEPRKLIIIDLVYLTLPVSLEKAQICSSRETGMMGKIEVNIKYSDSWTDIVLISDSVTVIGINFVLRAMTSRTKNAITFIRGFSIWKDVIISFSSMIKEQSINYTIFNIEGGGISFNNLSIKGENTSITGTFFDLAFEADSLKLKDVSFDNLRFWHDVIFVSNIKCCEVKKMKEKHLQNILISNFSSNKMRSLTESEEYYKSAGENNLVGRFLRSRESAKLKLEINNSSLSWFMCPEDYEPFGGCIYWSEKNQEGIVSSEAAAEEEENCELYFTNCTFSHNSLDTNIYFDQTKGGAVYLAFHSQTFPFVFQEVALFQNKANIGRDIFIRCPSISDKGESQKFGVNFNHSLWNEKNSIGAESEKEGKVVDYLEFITYRNSVIYVSGMEDSTKKFRSELLSSSASCLSCTSLRCMNDEYSKDKGGWDIFFCGSKDDPCRTVNYAMTHLSTFSSSPSTTQEAHDSSGNNSYFERRIRSLEKEEEQPSLHIIGEVYLINSVTWISIIIEGDTEGAGLKLESIWNEVNREEGIKQQAKLREGSRTTDYHVAIKGNCKMNNTNVKINADLPVSCLFLINDESAFEIERCAISSAKQETTSPTFLKIETGTLLCVLLSLSKVLFYRGSFFIDCSGIDEKSKVRVELKDCCFKEIKVSDQKSLIVFSIKEQNFIENNENQHTFEHSSSSSSLSSIPSDIPSFQHNISLSSLPSRISTCIRNSSIPVNISLQLIRTNISLSSRSAGKGFFLAASGCSAVHIQDCCFFYVDLASSANDKQKNTENAICMWDSSFVSFVNSSVDMQNTTFRTKLVGAIDSKNSYLSIDVASMKGNSIELDGFPSVAHNIICRSDETKKEGKGVIELVNDAGSSIYSKHSAKSEKRRIFEETYEELPDNFWIENNNCSLTGFPNDLMSCLFTPLPENVSKMIVGEGCEVQLTGKYLFNCYLMMRILANKTSGGKVLTELTEIAVTENLSSSSENAISAFFSRDVVERSNGAEVFAVLKFFDDRSLMKEQETYPLRVSDGKDLGRADNASTVMIIVVSTVIPTVGIGFIILLLFVRKKWKEKRRIAEYNENENLLNSINSDFSEITANKRENPRYLNFVNDYGTLAKLIDIPSDSQEPYLED